MNETPTRFWKFTEWISQVHPAVSLAMVVIGAIALVLLIRYGAPENGDHSHG